MSQPNNWYFEWNDGSYKQYDASTSQWLNTAKIDDNTIITIHGNKYQIHKLSAQESTQTNIRTQFSRKGIDQTKYDKIQNSQHKMEMDDNADINDCNQEWQWEDNDGTYKPYHTQISLEINKLQTGQSYTMQHGRNKYQIQKISENKCVQINMKTNYSRNVMLKVNDQNTHSEKWCWKDNSGNFVPYSDDICIEIEKLKPEESYFVFANNTKYQIIKISKDKCQQNNTKTNFSREVIRHKIYDQTPQKTSVENKDNTIQEKWYWMDDNGTYNAMDDVISSRLDYLNIGEPMINYVINSQYELIKLSNNKGTQRNTKSNKIREIRKMNCDKMENNDNSNNYDSKEYKDDKKENSDIETWYYKDDNDYKPIDDWLSNKINNLVIGEILKEKINGSWYEFKKISIGKGQQRNIKSNKMRQIRIAEYGWFYEDNDKSLKPYSDYLNKQLNSIIIRSTFTFSLPKNKTKYSVTKISKNRAKQTNLSTNVERNVVYKMTLNDDFNCDGISKKRFGGKDWLEERYNKAMKIGKIDRVKLIAKRNLKEDTAESHFRRCESQFMRSCQNMGASNNGLNKTITEVEYIINPKLIKKFEAKKKKLMKENKCNENKLNIILAWHGTKAANLKNIVENNFALNKISANTGNKGYYGCGIYFSEFAKISAAYGDGLLLCKVMLGKQWNMDSSKLEMGRSLENGYNSHVVVNSANKQYGQEVVIFDVDQILPCYIIKY